MDSRSPAPTLPTGSYHPPLLACLEVSPPDSALLTALCARPGVTAAVSDELDRRGLALTVPSTCLAPLQPGRTAGGRTITLRYLPARTTPLQTIADGSALMAHRTLFGLAEAGDVALIVGPSGPPASLLGGEAAQAAQRAGIAACLVAGDVRDVDEIVAAGLPVWCGRRTPATGRFRIEAAEINGPVDLAGIQVRAGDIAIADDSGVAFIPSGLFVEIARAILGEG